MFSAKGLIEIVVAEEEDEGKDSVVRVMRGEMWVKWAAYSYYHSWSRQIRSLKACDLRQNLS